MSYPVLLILGIGALRANVVNLVALPACWPGSALASRPELAGKGPFLRRFLWVAAAGGLVGAVLLLSTPSGVFRELVPYLVALASVTLLLQPLLSRWLEQRRTAGTHVLLGSGLFAISAYNGYFGAGSGVMTLALLLLVVVRHVATANALKNMLIGATSLVSAVLLMALARVDWWAVASLAPGLFLGSMIGPRLARRLPGGVLRWLVALLAAALAVWLWVVPGAAG